jgi:hypothetical protein
MTNFEKFLLVSEEIIAAHETAIELLEDLKINTEDLQEADFDSVRSKVEEMQTFVCTKYEQSYFATVEESEKFTTDAKFVELSIELYQNAKYSIEALEENESINETAIVMFFHSIRENVDLIRKLTRNSL